MRIVKLVAPIKINNHWVYRIDDTIEISDTEWDEIHKHYHQLIISQHHSYPFSKYLRELLTLAGEGK
jgi:hypothetical protein